MSFAHRVHSLQIIHGMALKIEGDYSLSESFLTYNSKFLPPTLFSLVSCLLHAGLFQLLSVINS